MVFLKRFSARDLIFYLLAILVMVFTFNAVQQMNEPDDPTYNEIRLLFEQEKVKYFSVEDNVLTLTLRGEGEDTSTLKYHLADFNVFYNDLHELIDSQRQAGIIQDYDYPAGWAEPWWFVYVPYLVILLGFGILMYTMYLRQNTGGGGGGGPSRFGHARTRTLADQGKKVTFNDVAGADLENLLNEAALLSAREDRRFITRQDLHEAMMKVIAGPEKRSRVVTPHARRLTAYHEAGHAVVIHELDSQDPVHQITIVPRGQAGGMTISLPREDRAYLSKRELEERIAVCLGGRVAEQLVLNDISTGASSDIQKASQTARAMVTKYGMSERLGTIAYGNENDEVFIGRTMAQARTYSEEVAGQIDEEVKAIVDRAYARCEEILTRRRQELELTARYLLVHETMSGEIFQKVFTDPAAPELALPEEDQPAQEG